MNPLPLLFLFVAEPIEPPKTVNGRILGTAERFATPGPGRVCIGSTSVDLEQGETAYVKYLGIHFASVQVIGPRGSFTVTEGDGSAPGRNRGQVFSDARGRTIERFRSNGRWGYAIYVPSPYDPNDEDPMIRVEGDALGRSRDSRILGRIRFSEGVPPDCRRRFEYGWGSLLGDD